MYICRQFPTRYSAHMATWTCKRNALHGWLEGLRGWGVHPALLSSRGPQHVTSGGAHIILKSSAVAKR